VQWTQAQPLYLQTWSGAQHPSQRCWRLGRWRRWRGGCGCNCVCSGDAWKITDAVFQVRVTGDGDNWQWRRTPSRWSHGSCYFSFSLEIAEDGDCHQKRRQRNGVAHRVHEVESLKHLLKQKQKHTSEKGHVRPNIGNRALRHKRTRAYLLLAPVVGAQVRGALGVVSPSAVDTGHLLPAPCRVTLAVGSPLMRDTGATSARQATVSLLVHTLFCFFKPMLSPRSPLTSRLMGSSDPMRRRRSHLPDGSWRSPSWNMPTTNYSYSVVFIECVLTLICPSGHMTSMTPVHPGEGSSSVLSSSVLHFFPPEGLFGSCSWSHVRSKVRDDYVYRL